MEKYDLNFNVQLSVYEKTILCKYEHLRPSLVLYKFERPKDGDYSELSTIQDFKFPYIYCLYGLDEAAVCSVYIGQSNNRLKNSTTLQRIKEHKTEYWSSQWSIGYVLTRGDNNLDETSLNYLENRLFSIIKENGYYKLWNTVTPSEGHPRKVDQANLDEDIDLCTYMFNIAGIKIDYSDNSQGFARVTNQIGINQDKININGHEYKLHFYSVKSRKGADARICKIDSFYKTKGTRDANDYYLLLKGSKLSDEYSSLDEIYARKAREYIDKYCLDDMGRLKEDVPITSHTTITSIIKGNHSSSISDWEEISGVLSEEQRLWLEKPQYLYLQYKEINAVAKKEGLRYIILKGSTVSATVKTDKSDNQTQRYLSKRKALEREGIIKNGVFTRDYKFDSKSMAEGVIQGKKMSGTWRRYCLFEYEDITRG